jgi:hypothetical protein
LCGKQFIDPANGEEGPNICTECAVAYNKAMTPRLNWLDRRIVSMLKKATFRRVVTESVDPYVGWKLQLGDWLLISDLIDWHVKIDWHAKTGSAAIRTRLTEDHWSFPFFKRIFCAFERRQAVRDYEAFQYDYDSAHY